MDRRASLEKLLDDKTARVGVIGLGYVGLPLIRAFVAAGFRTMGFDVDEHKVQRLLAGQSYIEHISSEWIADCVANGTFVPTADMRRLAEADALLICVPTPLSDSRDPGPDLHRSHRPADCRRAAPRASWSCWRARPIRAPRATWYCRSLPATGLRVGEDFFLAYSPEREDPGNPRYSASGFPRWSAASSRPARLAERLYGSRRGQDRARSPVAKWPRPARSWRTPTAR